MVLDLENEPGGTALGGVNDLGGYPWGAHYLPAPDKSQPDLVALLDELGCVESYDRSGQPIYREGVRCAAPQERVFAAGFWQPGLVPSYGFSRSSQEQVQAFLHKVHGYAGQVGQDGRKAFCFPMSASSEDPRFLALDDISWAAWLKQHHFEDELVKWLASYATRDDFGAEPSQTSAWFGIHYYAARMSSPQHPSAPFLTWPNGNHHIVRHLAQELKTQANYRPCFLGERLVTHVSQDSRKRGVWVDVLTSDGAERWWADRVIYALPGFLKPRILGEAYAGVTLETSAWMVANVHLSRRPQYRGAETAWDNVLYGSASLGYVVSTHQLGPPSGPTTLTWYLPFTRLEPHLARRELMTLDWSSAADVVMSDLERAHPDIRKWVRRIDIRRWGHAMPIPVPGTRTHPALREARQPRGRLHFAHTDLSGVALFEEAFAHGVRAAREVVTSHRQELGSGGGGGA